MIPGGLENLLPDPQREHPAAIEVPAFNGRSPNLRGDRLRILIGATWECGEGTYFHNVRHMYLSDVPKRGASERHFSPSIYMDCSSRTCSRTLMQHWSPVFQALVSPREWLLLLSDL